MDESIQDVNSKINVLSADPEVIRAYETRAMALSDYNTGMNISREEGRAEGVGIGLEQGIKASVKTFLELGISKEKVVDKLVENYKLPVEIAQRYIQEYYPK